MIRTRGLVGFCAVCLLLTAAVSAGQTVGNTDGAIVGTITDRTGGHLSGVVVTIGGPALMGSRSDVSVEDGSYRFHALPPGRYTLKFSLSKFKTETRDEIQVTLGSTVTVPVILDVESREEQLQVLVDIRALDQRDTSLATRMDAARLAELPGSRSMAAILAATPAVQLTRFDVGGSTTFAPGPYSAYGIAGFNRPMLEGISLSNLLPLAFSLDYGSFDQVWVGKGAYTPDWPTPGVHLQIVTKSGGDRYRGSLYAAYEDQRWQAHNIDEEQVALGAPSISVASRREANRLDSYYDVNADVGGFIRKQRLWWYVSGRDQRVGATRVTFPMAPIETRASSVTGKAELRLNDRHHLVLFGQRGHGSQPIRLDGFFGAEPFNESEASTANQRSQGLVWKAEWNAAFTQNLFAEARAGRFSASRAERPNGAGPRIEDQTTTSQVRGGNRDWQVDLQRDLFTGSINYVTDGRYGRHLVKAGGEVERNLDTETWKHGYPDDVLHVLNRNSAEVYLFQTPSRSLSGQWWYSAFVNDSWSATSRLTLNLGLRFDRFRVFLPAQEHPAGRFNPVAQSFAAVDNLIDWNVAAPRIGASYGLTADGRTLLKSTYGLYWLPTGGNVGFNANPNARIWWEKYNWSDDNRDGLWQAGEELALLDYRGGQALESLDPDLKPTYVNEVTARIEREVTRAFSIGSGAVWRGVRRQGTRTQSTRDFDAFTVTRTWFDPGPTGQILLPSGEGPGIQLHELSPEIDGLSDVVVRNVENSASDYFTLEVDAIRRFSGRWMLASSFSHTWHRDQASTYLDQNVRANILPLTPNDLINTDARGRHVFTTWSAKIQGAIEGPWQLRISPFLRHQSGHPFGRTARVTLNYGLINVLTEPIGTRRQDHITVLDLALEKTIPIAGSRAGVFLELYNLLNANPAQQIIWLSGSSFLRPTNIVPPRIARIGVKFDW